MKIILTQDCTGVGVKGQVINAADGFAQNYLISKGFAVRVDDPAAKSYRVVKTIKPKIETKEKLTKAEKRKLKKEKEKH